MAKDKGHRRPEAIPLPETVKDALLRLSKDTSYVSHSVKVEGEQEAPEKSELTSENHAFYLGKIIPDSFGEKARKLLGWGGGNDRIYTPEAIKGMLDYAFKNVKNGEKVRLVIGSSLSEFFNGPEDVENALTFERQRELIQKIALKQFHKDDDSLEIIGFEEDKAHALLYQVLKENIDEETGVVDVARALGGISTEIDNCKEIAARIDAPKSIRDMVNICPEAFFNEYDPNSLRFAAILYHAFEEDDRFRGAIENTVPPRVKESDSPSAAYYGLVEIAMRLSDISRGRFIHGGVERQEVYDQIITKIIKGGSGSYRNIKALEPLFDVFEGKRFETVHLKTKENHYELKKKRALARSRILLTTVLALGSTVGIYKKGKYDERQEREKINKIVDKDIYESLKTVSFYYSSPFIELSKEQNVNIFHKIVDDALEDIGRRYYLSGYPEILEEIKPFLQGFLLENKSKLSVIHGGNDFVRIDLEDSFMQKYAIFLRNKGIDIERPYQKLMPYIGDFNKVLGSDENIVFDDKKNDSQNSATGGPFRLSEISHIGTFYSGSDDIYEFYWYTSDDGKKHIVAKEGIFKYSEFVAAGPAGHYEERECSRFSTKKAREGIKQFLYAIQRFNAVPLMEIDKVMNETRMRDYDNGHKTVCADMREEVDDARKMIISGIRHYRDEITGVEFEYYIWDDFDEKTLASEPCLMARKPGDSNFTSQTGLEMTRYVKKVVDEDWHVYTLADYIESNLPFDFAAIKREIESILNFACGIENVLDIYEDNDSVKKQIWYIKNMSEATEEDIRKYDGSYKSAKEILDDMDSLRILYSELTASLDEYTFIDECTQEPVDTQTIMEDAGVVTRLNLIFNARNALMGMEIPWPRKEEKVS